MQRDHLEVLGDTVERGDDGMRRVGAAEVPDTTRGETVASTRGVQTRPRRDAFRHFRVAHLEHEEPLPQLTYLCAPRNTFLCHQCWVERVFTECRVNRDVATTAEGRSSVPGLLAVVRPIAWEWQANHRERYEAVGGSGGREARKGGSTPSSTVPRAGDRLVYALFGDVGWNLDFRGESAWLARLRRSVRRACDLSSVRTMTSSRTRHHGRRRARRAVRQREKRARTWFRGPSVWERTRAPLTAY